MIKKQRMKEEEHVLSHLATLNPSSPEYSEAVRNLEILKKVTNKWPSADTIVVAAVSMAQILLVLNFERCDVLTSKALSFMLKSRA